MCITLIKSDWIRLYSALLLLFSVLGASGQVTRLARFELPTGLVDQEAFQSIPADVDGIYLYRRAVTDNNHSGLQVIHLDTALRQVWQGFIPIQGNMSVERATVLKSQVYVLLRDPFRANANFQIMRVDPGHQEFVLFNVNNAIQFFPSSFIVTTRAALIGGYYNGRPLVFYYSFTNQQSRILPGFTNDVGDLDQVRVNEDSTITVVVAAKNLQHRKTLWIRNYDLEGNLTQSTILDPGQERHLLTGQLIKAGDEQLLFGVYGRHIDYSRGFFVAHVKRSGEYRIDYYYFGDLQHFFSYFKPKHEQRVLQRIQRRKQKGKQVHFNYRLLVHEMVPFRDKYLVLAESYYPTYRYLGDIFSRGVIFDGYKYTHAALICLSKNGKLLWDNSFEINDMKSFDLRPLVDIYPGDKGIVMMYDIRNSIRTKVILDSEVLQGKFSERIPTERDYRNTGESTSWSQLTHWYNQYFFSYGVRHVRTGVDGQAMNVLFVDKLSYGKAEH